MSVIPTTAQAIRSDAKSQDSLVAEGVRRLEAVATVLGFQGDIPTILGTFRRMTAGWGDAAIGRAPHWPSDVSDDHTPFELSIALQGGEPELRILAEAMDFPPSLESSRRASARLDAELEQAGLVTLDRVRLVRDLFLPEEANGRFLVWHAAVFRRGRAPDFKIYFNLHARGRAKAAVLAEEALRRLGFHRAWGSIAQAMALRSSEHEELMYFSLDLAKSDAARAKLYLRHHRGTASDLEAASALARAYSPGEVSAFAHAIGGGDGPYGGRGPATCFSFTDPRDERPSSATAYVPTPWAAPSDAVARDRVVSYLGARGIDARSYEETLRCFVKHPLEAGSSLHSYLAFRWQGTPRITAYLSPELYRVEPARPAPSVWTTPARPPATAIVRRYEDEPIIHHPLFARLRAEPVDLEKLAILMANFHAGIVNEFPRRLATLTAKVPDEAVRSILAKQLNDEMGNGDVARSHRVLFTKITGALAPWTPATLEADTAPGRALGAVLERSYVTEGPWFGVGASLLVEVAGKHVDAFIGDEFRRQTTIPPSELEWLHLHETLEIDHADESMLLAKMIPAGANDEAWAGALAIADGSRAYFDALYARFFG